MRWARRRPLRDDEVWTILRVDNCSEVDLVGNSYKQDGKYYDNCCDLENENEDECDEWWKPVLIFFYCLAYFDLWWPYFRGVWDFFLVLGLCKDFL